jgi:hypothetical protein
MFRETQRHKFSNVRRFQAFWISSGDSSHCI